jgi:small subunit ribosomal protein S18
LLELPKCWIFLEDEGVFLMAVVAGTKKRRRFARPKRVLDSNITFDYKDVQLLRRFVSEHGKIVPRRISGSSAQQQRDLTRAVKIARIMALIPYGQAYDPRVS